MKVDNPLSSEFLLSYPADAARTLEQVSAESVAALFAELPVTTAAPVIAAMLPDKAADCLSVMAPSSAAKLLAKLPVSAAVRIFRLLSLIKQNELPNYFSDKTRNSINRYQKFSVVITRDLLDPNVDMLTENLTVAEAIRRIGRFDHAVSCEIYIVDDVFHLTGVVKLGSLLNSNNHARLCDIMDRTIKPVSLHASAEALLSHPGWVTHKILPVVERDNTLVGLLQHSQLLEAIGEATVGELRNPLGSLLSLTGLYWLSLAQLLDNMLSFTEKEKQRETL